MEGGQVLVAIAAEELDITHGLRAFILDGKTPVVILHIMCCGYDIVGDFKEIFIITAGRTFKAIRYIGAGIHHNS